MSVRLPLPLLLMATLAPSLTPTAAEDTSPQSTVPVYVPGYRTENWDGLVGSVMTSVSPLGVQRWVGWALDLHMC